MILLRLFFHSLQLPYDNFPSTTVVIVWPFFVIFVIFVRSADRERCVRIFNGDDERCDVRDDGLDNEFLPSLTLNFTFNIFTLCFGVFPLNCSISLSFCLVFLFADFQIIVVNLALFLIWMMLQFRCVYTMLQYQFEAIHLMCPRCQA